LLRVFISHSTDDRQRVEQEVVSLLRSAGIEVWYSVDNIRASEQWERAIVKGMQSCDWFLVVMTRSAARSPWVRSEVYWAIENRWDRIVPVLLEDCTLLDFHLRMPQLQFVDFREPTETGKNKLLNCFGIHGETASAPSHHSQATELTVLSQTIVEPPKQLPLNAPRAHFHCGPWVPAEYFIGREEQLAEAKHLIEARQNFLIIGKPRAGKTSFCQKLKRDLDGSTGSNILISYLNLQQASELTIETFLEHTILNIAGEIARKVFNCRYMDLMSPAEIPKYPFLQDDPIFKAFLAVFRHVRERTHSHGQAPNRPLATQEFVQLTRDLLDIAAERGRGGFMIFYDEANRLPMDISGNLLISIGEALQETGVMGGYVASEEMEEHFDQLDQLFGAKLQVGPFQTPDEMTQLLSRYYFDDMKSSLKLPASPAALHTLWKVSEQVPFLIQLIADRSFRIARGEHAQRLETDHVTKAYELVRRERPNAFRFTVDQ
jgi:hypothetical protein